MSRDSYSRGRGGAALLLLIAAAFYLLKSCA